MQKLGLLKYARDGFCIRNLVHTVVFMFQRSLRICCCLGIICKKHVGLHVGNIYIHVRG